MAARLVVDKISESNATSRLNLVSNNFDGKPGIALRRFDQAAFMK